MRQFLLDSVGLFSNRGPTGSVGGLRLESHAAPDGVPDQNSRHPGLLSASRLNRTTVGYCTSTSPATDAMRRSPFSVMRSSRFCARRCAETGSSIVMPYQTTSASSRLRILGFWRERGMRVVVNFIRQLILDTRSRHLIFDATSHHRYGLRAATHFSAWA